MAFKGQEVKKQENLVFSTHSGEFVATVEAFYNFIPPVFKPEKNRLKWWHGLKTLEYGKDVEVGILVTTNRLNELQNSTSKSVPEGSFPLGVSTDLQSVVKQCPNLYSVAPDIFR